MLKTKYRNKYNQKQLTHTPRAFDTCVFESAMDEFSGKDETFVRHGLEKLVDVFKRIFSQFWIFLQLLEIFNVKNKI